MKKKETKKPVSQLRFGRVIASIWENEVNGSSLQSVTFEKLYQKDDKSWGYSKSFSASDLLNLSEVARQAFLRLSENEEAEQREEKTASSQAA